MEKESAPADPAPPSQVVPRFRMRISHFLLLTTVCFVVGSIMTSWIDSGETSSEIFWFTKLYTGVASLLYGAAFTAVLILLWRRCRHGQFELDSPGHWLLVLLASGALLQGLGGLLLSVYRHAYSDNPTTYLDFYTWNLRKLLLCSTVGVTCFVVAWLIRGNLYWKSIVVIGGGAMIALVPLHLLVLMGLWRPWFPLAHMYASLGVSAAALPLMLLACLYDSRRSVRRDWLHWAGVGVFTLLALAEFSSALYWLLNW